MIEGSAYKNQKHFAIGLIVLELIVIPIYAVFVRVQPHHDEQSIGYNYPSYMDLIVIVIMGSGFLNTFIRTYSYMGMIHNWLFYVVSIQIFFLFEAMWKRILFGQQLFDRNHTDGTEWTIWIRQQDYTLAAYSCSVMNIAFGILFGRIGPFEKLILVVIGMIAYTLNAIILHDLLNVYDVGGSIFCHAFGAYFGMAISFVVSRVRRPITKIQHNYETIIFSYIGCFFIFCYAPSINSQYLTETPFQKSIVIMNTILSMCCSVMASFAMSIFIKNKFSVIDLFNGSLSGCIGAGASTGLFVNPCACMILGTISGIVCVLGMEYLTGWIQKNWKIFDTYGVHNVRGLPGIIGGLAGAVGIALSYTIPPDALQHLHYLAKHQGRTIGRMVGFQVLGTFTTVIFALLVGLFTGWIITHFYNIEAKNFYMDNIYFELPQDAIVKFKKKGAHIKKKQSFMDNQFLEFNQSTPGTEQGSLGQLTQQGSSGIILPSKILRSKKLVPLVRKLTFQQKIDQTVENLNNPPVKQVEDERSQFQQEIRRKRSQMKVQLQNVSFFQQVKSNELDKQNELNKTQPISNELLISHVQED